MKKIILEVPENTVSVILAMIVANEKGAMIHQGYIDATHDNYSLLMEDGAWHNSSIDRISDKNA